MTTTLFCENVKFQTFMTDEDLESRIELLMILNNIPETYDTKRMLKNKVKFITVKAPLHNIELASCVSQQDTWKKIKDNLLKLIKDQQIMENIRDAHKITDIAFNTTGIVDFNVDINRLIDIRFGKPYDVLEQGAILYVAMIKQKNTNWIPIIQSKVKNGLKIGTINMTSLETN